MSHSLRGELYHLLLRRRMCPRGVCASRTPNLKIIRILGGITDTGGVLSGSGDRRDSLFIQGSENMVIGIAKTDAAWSPRRTDCEIPAMAVPRLILVTPTRRLVLGSSAYARQYAGGSLRNRPCPGVIRAVLVVPKRTTQRFPRRRQCRVNNSHPSLRMAQNVQWGYPRIFVHEDDPGSSAILHGKYPYRGQARIYIPHSFVR